MRMWNLRTLRQAGKLKNQTMEMGKYGTFQLSAVAYKKEIASGNYAMFYSRGINGEKDIAIMLRNDIVKPR